MKKKRIAIIAFGAMFVLGVTADAYAAAIGNTVWNDRNANGVQDVGEEGISGVKIKLYNGNNKYTDVTNSRGRYKFKHLGEGHYKLIVAQETLPEGCYNTHDRDGDNDGIYGGRYLKKDDYFTHADFGYHCPTVKYVAIGQTSPATGPNTVIAIIVAAFIAGIAIFGYKKHSEKKALKK